MYVDYRLGQSDCSLTLILPRGGYHPLEIFPCRLQNQKESDLSQLDNLKYNICGHFDEKKNRKYPLGEGKVSRQRFWVGGWLPPEKIKSHYLKKNDCMVLKITVYSGNVISF